ncbi:DUF3846 domain-containing protein [Streptomyces sp. OE57]|uniref:DUF3846 domain-containing protein n=1 Tax=Streptomyces lacaronensis TaxID=3379885 RepID=UPI0039B77A90
MPLTPSALLLACAGQLVEIDLPTAATEEESHARQAVLRATLRCDRFDVVALTTQWDMWIDDEGLFNHPVNPFATALARRFGFVYQDYHGPVLLTGGAERTGTRCRCSGPRWSASSTPSWICRAAVPPLRRSSPHARPGGRHHPWRKHGLHPLLRLLPSHRGVPEIMASHGRRHPGHRGSRPVARHRGHGADGSRPAGEH